MEFTFLVTEVQMLLFLKETIAQVFYLVKMLYLRELVDLKLNLTLYFQLLATRVKQRKYSNSLELSILLSQTRMRKSQMKLFKFLLKHSTERFGNKSLLSVEHFKLQLVMLELLLIKKKHKGLKMSITMQKVNAQYLVTLRLERLNSLSHQLC